MGVLTVSRQLGSGGDLIAAQIAEKLAWTLFDSKLVEEIASLTDVTVEEVEQFDEKGEGRIRQFLKRLLIPELNPEGFPLSSAAYFPEFGLEFPYIRDRDREPSTTLLDRGTYQLLITSLIQEYGQAGRAVIVGRASQCVLATHPKVFHVKVVAPFTERCKRIMEIRGVDAETARNLCQKHDHWRTLYLRNFHNSEWDDPLLYHATVNSGKMSLDDAVNLIVGRLVSLV